MGKMARSFGEEFVFVWLLRVCIQVFHFFLWKHVFSVSPTNGTESCKNSGGLADRLYVSVGKGRLNLRLSFLDTFPWAHSPDV